MKRISWAWWNTSLSPSGKPKDSLSQKKFACEIVHDLLQNHGISCLALGEISSSDLSFFASQNDLHDYEIFDGTFKKGHLGFDTAVFFRKDTFRLTNYKYIIVASGTHRMNLATRIDLSVMDDNQIIHLFVSHWSSRLWCHENSPDRHLIGIRLRDEIVELDALYNGDLHAILLGDYNDEPCDLSLSDQLLASRDRRFVRKNPKLLYNPFCRLMGESLPHLPGKPCDSVCGSYFHSQGKVTHWRTFDQIIFSSVFLGKSKWQLNEKYTKILPIRAFENKDSFDASLFDHYPVIGVIEKDENHGEL